MKYPIAIKEIDTDFEYYNEVVSLNESAGNFLLQFKSITKILDSWLYYSLAEILCVFLIKVVNNSSVYDDEYFWVIVGDLPTVYLVIDNIHSLKEALEVYVELAEDWIKKVKKGKSVEDCYPFSKDTSEMIVSLLDRRVKFIKKKLLKNIDDVSIQIEK